MSGEARGLLIADDRGLPLDAVTEAIAILATRGAGKALALLTPLPTPSGWTTMGDVRVGDQLYDDQGRPCVVRYVAPVPQGNECYRVLFSDKSEIVADADHLWMTSTLLARSAAALADRRAVQGIPVGRPGRWQCQRRVFPSLVTTADMAQTVLVKVGDSGRLDRNHSIPTAGPLVCSDIELPIDPYVLGVWLGDGRKQSAYVTTSDMEVLAEAQRAGYSIGPPINVAVNERSATFYIGAGSGKCLNAELRRMDLLCNKHIPPAYLRAATEQRLALLQGLIRAVLERETRRTR